MKRITPLMLLLVALSVAACGGKTLDTSNVEKDIKKIASEGGVATEVKCPDEVTDVKKGKTYECTITYAGNEKNKQTVEMKIAANDESEFANQKAVQDEGLIRQIVAQSDEDPATVCEHLEESILEQLGGDDCPTKAAEEDDGKPTDIKSIEIQGDSATMVTSESTTTFERDTEGGWIVTAIE
ncbi:MAG TPA: DUF4333 domain-containing protein [Thermoleophilaceae bacterium]|jgi:hypothetical protein